MTKDYDVIIIGGGHAGIEASHATATLGLRSLLVTLSIDKIANMPCNPHIGGSAKGVVVREIDALGGIMGIAADARPLQIKMLNTGKGPAVQCLRTQQDKNLYPAKVLDLLRNTPNLEIVEDEAIDLIVKDGVLCGVKLKNNGEMRAKSVILANGTYLNARVYTGSDGRDEGPDGEPASLLLTDALHRLGVKTWRLKTGTPPRLSKATIDFSNAAIEPGMDGDLAFSYSTESFTPLDQQLPCYLIYTSDETLRIIRDHLDDSALFNGVINSTGPRYCPSIESKVVRFADKPRHQLFLEPEYLDGDSFYLQGFSTAMPKEVQEKMVHSLPGLEHAKILKYAYQIEYDAVRPEEFDSTLMVKRVPGLYVAGQICGTSGYEEAAGLGLMAGLNAAHRILGQEKVILKRDESYIGVMIDDLVTKGTSEPYRLLTSRAEYRLLLRHDNADQRLTEYGYQNHLIKEERYQRFHKKMEDLEALKETLRNGKVLKGSGIAEYLEGLGFEKEDASYNAYELVKRPGVEAVKVLEFMGINADPKIARQAEIEIKYEGYIEKAKKEAGRM